MNKYILTTCGIMLLILFVNQAYESSEYQTMDSGSYTFDEQSGTFTVNGSDTTYTLGEQNLVLGISVNEGIMVAVIAIVALISVIGVTALTLDISETAERAIANFAIFGAFWGIFSVLLYDRLTEIPSGIGWFLYLLISIIHLFGILKIVYK